MEDMLKKILTGAKSRRAQEVERAKGTTGYYKVPGEIRACPQDRTVINTFSGSGIHATLHHHPPKKKTLIKVSSLL